MGRPASDTDELTFGIVSGDRLARASLTQVCDAISTGAGRRVRPELCDSYGALTEGLETGRLELAWAPPLIAHRLTQRRLAQVVSCPRRPGGLAYHSVLFVGARHRARKPDELRGARAAWVDPSSLSGCVLARRWLARQGLEPDRLFSRQVHVKTHSAVARAVFDGEADVGSTYANVDARGRVVDAGWSEVGAAADAVHVVATIGPVPADAIVVTMRVDDPLRDTIATALGALTGPAIAAARSLFRADRFERPPPRYLEVLDQLIG